MVRGYIENIYNYYLWTLTLSDPRTKGWLLVDSPLPTLFYVALYFVIVWIGPKIMQNKKPYKLTSELILYNLAMTILNLYISIQILTASIRLRYNWFCEPCRQSKHPDELQIVNALWWYYFSKLLEFADTFFFILRKKDRQLTFLHIYHHSTMFPLWWIGTKWVPSGSSAFPAMINAGVHVVMYPYYGLSALGPHVAKHLWWKKYLTIIQLVQFTIGLLLGISNIINDCGLPHWMNYTMMIYMISYIILFGQFYRKVYKVKKDNDQKYLATNKSH